jgi:hypothetical protein
MVGYSALMGKLFSVFFTKVLNHICLLIPLLYSRLPSFHISFKGQQRENFWSRFFSSNCSFRPH